MGERRENISRSGGAAEGKGARTPSPPAQTPDSSFAGHTEGPGLWP